MNFLNKPNLPEKNVKFIVADGRISKSISIELNRLGVNIFFVPVSDKIQKPVSAHPDIHFCHLGKGEIYTSQEYCEILTNQINDNNITAVYKNTAIEAELGYDYPCDVLLNCVPIGDYLICNPKTIYKGIIDNTDKKILSTKQGYTKCSTCVVSEDAIITDDLSVMESAKSKMDVLYVPHGEVALDGYEYGFIGGCCGKLSKDVLAFTGNLNYCSLSAEIKSFCLNHKVNCISLSNERLYDYGSLMPVIEA